MAQAELEHKTYCRYISLFNPGLFLFSFVLLKQLYFEKTVDFSRIWTRIIRVEVKYADHLTTIKALQLLGLHYGIYTTLLHNCLENSLVWFYAFQVLVE